MSNVIASLEKVLLPFAVKIGKQPHVNAIKNGFIRLMPLTLAGAMFVLRKVRISGEILLG
ncbi:PTS diacetylchitobiose transporter subunit IIC [Escherichia coli]|nr:PTS diacetylchitobiose transporter subunit IIC [Escherichia coli]PAZ32395.1 PTS diacetylchitobiose transporter subunit IIC [Escherichia coli]PAZ37284.1 PTS diacetylchitobiose transporter subunit IIC [Escherichia coli]PAZ43416.1 PTS diacetylchitobiose transporter subunit IIC [Escherichia coli]PAZ52223.1 PTS diacetylchitobiose transporter subunit IIC [Escherichia coli]